MKKIIFALVLVTVFSTSAVAQEDDINCTEIVRADLCDRLEDLGERMMPMLQEFLGQALAQGQLDLNRALEQMLNDFEQEAPTKSTPTSPSIEI